jgi:uncharacterized protein YdhG (YjbR/CyaY superfamily)
MEAAKINYHTVEEYLAAVPEAARARAEELRAAIKEAAPMAQEIISYQMPAYKLNGTLVYFGVWKAHLGFYPSSTITQDFQDALAPYKTSKGAIQFALDAPIPVELVKRIVAVRVAENEEKVRRGRTR